MAERRYGFRFSFAEGCVIVGGMIGASFFVFLFGVYTGRELEARKTAENTRTVRVNSNFVNEKTPDMPVTGNEANAAMREQDKSEDTPQPTQETPKTVVVVTPQKPIEQTAAASIQTPPSTPPEEEALIKTELLQKTPSASVKKEEKPLLSAARVPQETKPSPEAKTAAFSRKESSTKGGWSVQVHATRDQESARRLANQLRSQGYAPVISRIVRDREVWYRVRVGSFANADEARTSVERFRREGKFPQAYPVSN
ncbi:MAG: SPOR domain-containing protein [Candidatus Binatia bacterium]